MLAALRLGHVQGQGPRAEGKECCSSVPFIAPLPFDGTLGMAEEE